MMYICLCNDQVMFQLFSYCCRVFVIIFHTKHRTESLIMKVNIVELHICQNCSTCKYCSPFFGRVSVQDVGTSLCHVSYKAGLIEVFYHSGRPHV